MNIVDNNPYVGPRTFRKDEGHLFFGREREERDLLALVATEQLVLFYAQSGTGKSSLVNTRLIPGLEEKGYEVLPVGRVSGGDLPSGIEVGNVYVCNLMRNMVKRETEPQVLSKLSLADFLAGLDRDKKGYFYDNSPILETSSAESYTPSKRALIIDQFEELFSTHPEAWERRADFFRQLAQAMQDDPYLWVVLVMREDYIAYLDPYAYLLPGGLRVRYYMQRLERDAALKAIKGPAEGKQRPYADGVAEKLVDDLSRSQIARPDGKVDFIRGQYVEPIVLQAVCYSLWEKLPPQGSEITFKNLDEVGDVNEALGKYYASGVETVAEMEEVKKKEVREPAIREWFGKKLITEGGIRNLIVQSSGRKSGGLDDDVVQIFAKRGDLVRAEKRGGVTFYELAHDRLVEPILANNKKWEADHSSPLKRQAALWSDQGRNESWLLSGEALAEVEQWAKDHEDELTEIEAEFLEACRAKQAERTRVARERSARRQRSLLIGVTTALVISIFLGTMALIARNEARSSQNAALTSEARAIENQQVALTARADAVTAANLAYAGQLAVQSQTTTNNQLGLLLAIEALNQAERAGKSYFSIAYDVLRNAADQAGVNRLSGPTGSVNVVAFSSDGHWLASGSDDGSVFLWDVTSENPAANPLILGGYAGVIRSLAFSRDGGWLASGSDDGSVLLWDLKDLSTNAVMLGGHAGPVYALAFSSDDHRLASGSDDSTIRLWNLTAKDPANSPIILKGHTNYINSLAFSLDGHWLASGSFDNTAALWNLTAEDIATSGILLSGHMDQVYSVVFSPDSHWLASGSIDSTVRLWDISARNPAANPLVLSGHTDAVYRVAFSPNNRWLASGSGDGTVRLWDITAENISVSQIVLSGHTGSVYRVAFSPDGHWLTSGGDDSSILVWDMTADKKEANPVVLSGHSGSVNSLAFDPDGHWLASGSLDGTVILWDISTQFEIEFPISQYQTVDKLQADTMQIKNLAFSPDGFWLASSSTGSDVKLWNFQSGIPTEYWANLQGPVNSLSFDSYGGTLYGGNENGVIYSWILGTENPVRKDFFQTNDQSQASLAMCPYGDCWADVSSDNTVSFWYWAGNSYQVVSLKGQQQETVKSLAISPDGHWLVSGSADSTINVWDLTDITKLSSDQPIVLSQGDGAGVNALTFSRDSHWLASAGNDGAVLVWDASGQNIQVKPSLNFMGEAGSVETLAFSPRGRWLASGGNGANIKLWDVYRPASKPIILKGDEGSVFSLAFSPDGRWLVSGGDDNSIRVWGPDIDQLEQEACRTIGRNLEWLEWKSYFTNEDYHTTCPDNPFPASVANHFLHPGDQLARSGDITNAVAKYNEVLEKCPEERCIGFKKMFVPDPVARAEHLAAQALLEEGDSLAQDGNVEDAINKYQDAIKLDPAIIPDNASPEDRATQMVMNNLKNAIYDLLYSSGDYRGAASKLADAQKLYPNFITLDDAGLLNNLCWEGSLTGMAKDVKDACELLGKLAPDDGNYRDSRGLNRGILGDYQGAIEDFEYAVKWFPEHGFEDRVKKRQDWLMKLKAGQNPFDEKTLEELKNE